MAFLASLLAGIVGKITEAITGWLAPYWQGRNAEQVKQAERAARQSGDISEAQSHTVDVVVDDDWLHRSSHPDQTTDLSRPK